MSSFRCEPCRMTFNGIIPLKAHLASEKHKKKVSLEENASNFVTDPGKFENDQYVIKRSESECIDAPEKLGFDQYIKKVGSEYKCVVCNVSLTSIAPAQSHCKGKKHLKTISQISDSVSITDDKTGTSSDSEGFSGLEQMLSLRIMDINDILQSIKIIKANEPIEF